MIGSTECRRFPRLSTGPEYQVRFQVDGHKVIRAMLQNISASGCGLQVPMEEARHLSPDCRLEAIYLDHPWLPHVPLEGQVVHLLGKVPGKTSGYVLAGVAFTAITPLVQVLIAAHIEDCLLEKEA